MNTGATSTMPHSPVRSPNLPPSTAMLSEEQYLQRRLSETQAEIGNTVQNLTASLGTAADIGLWTQRYPWIAVGAAAATGLITANILIPPKQHHAAGPIYVWPQQHGSAPAPANGHGSFLGSIFSNLIQTALHGALLSVVQSAVTSIPGQTPAGHEPMEGEPKESHSPYGSTI